MKIFLLYEATENEEGKKQIDNIEETRLTTFNIYSLGGTVVLFFAIFIGLLLVINKRR